MKGKVDYMDGNGNKVVLQTKDQIFDYLLDEVSSGKYLSWAHFTDANSKLFKKLWYNNEFSSVINYNKINILTRKFEQCQDGQVKKN